MYVPAGSTWRGISTAWLKVTTVRRFNSSAAAKPGRTTPTEETATIATRSLLSLMLLFPSEIKCANHSPLTLEDWGGRLFIPLRQSRGMRNIKSARLAFTRDDHPAGGRRRSPGYRRMRGEREGLRPPHRRRVLTRASPPAP